MGFEEPHFQLMVYFVEPEFLRVSNISAYATLLGRLVLRYGLERPVIIRFWDHLDRFRTLRLAFFIGES